MADDKKKRRRSFQSLPGRIQRLLTFGIFAAAWEIPEEERTRRMVDWLRWMVDGLHAEGYAAPLWLFEALQYYERMMIARHAGPTADEMVYMVEGIFEDLPEEEQSAAVVAFLDLCRRIYAEGGVDVPPWLRLALERYEVE